MNMMNTPVSVLATLISTFLGNSVAVAAAPGGGGGGGSCNCPKPKIDLTAIVDPHLTVHFTVTASGEAIIDEQLSPVLDLEISENVEYKVEAKVTSMVYVDNGGLVVTFPHCAMEYQVPTATSQENPVHGEWEQGSSVSLGYETDGMCAPYFYVTTPEFFWLRITGPKSDNKGSHDPAGSEAEVSTSGPTYESVDGTSTGTLVYQPPGALLAFPMGAASVSDTQYRSAGQLTAGGPISDSLAAPDNLSWDVVREVASASPAVVQQYDQMSGSDLDEVHYVTEFSVLRLQGWDSETSTATAVENADETLLEVFEISDYNPGTHTFTGNAFSWYRLETLDASGGALSPGSGWCSRSTGGRNRSICRRTRPTRSTGASRTG